MNVQTASKAHLTVSIKWDLFQTIFCRINQLHLSTIGSYDNLYVALILWCVWGHELISRWIPTMPRICTSPTHTWMTLLLFCWWKKMCSLVYLCQHWGQLCCLALYALSLHAYSKHLWINPLKCKCTWAGVLIRMFNKSVTKHTTKTMKHYKVKLRQVKSRQLHTGNWNQSSLHLTCTCSFSRGKCLIL